MDATVLGIRRGWEGLTHVRTGGALDTEYLMPLDRLNTRTIDRVGGTVLHPSRMRPERLPSHLTGADVAPYATGDGLYDLTPVVMRNIEALGLDHLVVIGGDDTIGF